MALPKLNDQPKFDLVIPSSQKNARFRPFLVKEEKILLIALETNDQTAMLNAIADTIEACSVDNIETTQLTTFDIEYLFTQLRSKSVGETSKINMICKECGGETEQQVNVDKVKMEGGTKSNIIDVAPGIQIELQYPSYKKIMTDEIMKSEKASDATFAMIRACVKAVLTEEERIDMAEEDPKAVDEFIESMSSQQFNMIREYIDDIPTMRHTHSWTCEHCETEQETVLEGMQAFFS